MGERVGGREGNERNENKFANQNKCCSFILGCQVCSESVLCVWGVCVNEEYINEVCVNEVFK